MSTQPANQQFFNQDDDEGQLSLDIYQNKDFIFILAPIAGINQNDIKLTITDDVLQINGSRKFPVTEEMEEALSKECFWGDFSRSIVLPENVDTGKIEASFKNSVLKITIPKIERVKSKVIEIK